MIVSVSAWGTDNAWCADSGAKKPPSVRHGWAHGEK